MLTTFYMFRLVLVVFGQSTRSESAGHAHESPPVILMPLRLLAIFSVIGGFIGIENVYGAQFEGGPALTPMQQLVAPFAASPVAALLGLVAVGFGFFAAYWLYARAASDPLPAKLGALSTCDAESVLLR